MLLINAAVQSRMFAIGEPVLLSHLRLSHERETNNGLCRCLISSTYYNHIFTVFTAFYTAFTISYLYFCNFGSKKQEAKR